MNILFGLVLGTALFCGQNLFASCCTWSGFYVGINSGYGWSDCTAKTTVDPQGNSYFDAASIASIAANGTFRLHPSGYTGGVQVGWNKQLASPIVWGLETDFGAFLLNKSKRVTVVYPDVPPATYTIDQKVKTNWLFTLRPRLGFAYENWLAFITGGFALTDFKYEGTFSDNLNSTVPLPYPNAFEKSSKSKVSGGWTIGAGLEYAFSRCLSLCFSYLHAEFDNTLATSGSFKAGPDGATMDHSTSRFRANLVRLGLNWRI